MARAPRTGSAVILLAACTLPNQRGEQGQALRSLPFGVSALVPVPESNPLGCGRVALGRRLFFEKQLSRSGKVACATCHSPGQAFTDGRALAVGEGGVMGRRNSPTLLNRAYGRTQFFDGRAASLEAQALEPLTNVVELANTHEEIVRRLASDASYRRDFAAAFGNAEVTIGRVAAAVASFERTLVTGDSPADRFLAGRDSSALSAAAQRGAALFHGKARCLLCHEPPLFTDELFHNTGVAWRDGAFADSGRFTITQRREVLGAFKTPTLRNIERTAPYMHDGSMSTLADVLEFYDTGGRTNPHLDPLIRPLGLSENEKRELVAFLKALTGTAFPGSCD